MSSFWSAWIIVLTTISLIATTWLLFSVRKTTLDENNEAKTGHVYDGIEEYDNPLPAWWFNLFLITLLFAVIYLLAYPGMGNFKGFLNWSSLGQWEKDVSKAEEKYGHIYAAYAETPISELSTQAKAMKIGQRLFANNCASCHGSDAGGTLGYPNLRDGDWLYGGTAEQILSSITEGRSGAMPAWAAILGSEGLEDMSDYVINLGQNPDAVDKEAASTYSRMCATCHGSAGQGNIHFGAPNLSDAIWLYGGARNQVMKSIASGRKGNMPAHQQLLSKEKIHILAAYIYSLSN